MVVEKYVMMATDNSVISDEYDVPDGVLTEMLQHYTLSEMHKENLTLCRILSDGRCWVECLEEISY